MDFNRTDIAFSHKSDPDLKRAHMLFTAIGFNWLVNAGPGILKLAMALRMPVTGIIKSTVFKQFCGGENIQECEKTISLLHSRGVGTILDYSVEGEENEANFDLTKKEIISTIHKAEGNPAIPFSVFKVTGVIALDILEKVSSNQSLSEADHSAWERGKARVEEICQAAFQHQVRLFIDAEETWIQPAIDQLAENAMHKYNQQRAIIFNTVQLYRHDRLAYLKEMFQRCEAKNVWMGVKLVRGAYMEKERDRAMAKGYASPIQPDKAASDRDYDEALHFCMDHIHLVSLCAGTHNENSSAWLARLMAENGLSNGDDRVWFSQLLGMSDHISFNLASEGYCVAKYVPYGPVKAVMPYLIRRAQENTSAKGQAGRELRLIRAELKRRKEK